MHDLKNSSFFPFFDFDLYILNFDILFSYSNKQDSMEGGGKRGKMVIVDWIYLYMYFVCKTNPYTPAMANNNFYHKDAQCKI